MTRFDPSQDSIGDARDREIRARIADDEVVVVVSDWGCGVKAPSYQPGLGLGLGLMDMLSDSLAVHGGDGGTEVTLRFLR